jgi:hypothetical protein
LDDADIQARIDAYVAQCNGTAPTRRTKPMTLKELDPPAPAAAPEPAPPPVPTIQAPPTEAEKRLVAAYHKRQKDRPSAPKVRPKPSPNGKSAPYLPIATTPAAATVWNAATAAAFGSVDADFTATMLSEIVAAVDANAAGDREVPINGFLAAMAGIGPQDEAEGILALQMVQTSRLALQMMRKLGAAQAPETIDSLATAVTKLSRTYTTQMEALAKYRRRGEQTVRVEHVTVQPGGQAVVGIVNSAKPADGGGRDTEPIPEIKPVGAHRLTHAPAPEIPASDPVDTAVLVTRDDRGRG